MATISFIDNDFKYARAFIKRDYTEIAEEIKNTRKDMDYSFECNDKIYGYKITTNKLLTEVYGEDFFVVHFCFLNIDTLHDSEQERCICKLLDHLMEEITEKKGYYNLKLPANIVDLIRAYNQLKYPFIFCGGTVEQYIYDRSVPDCNKSGLNVFMADKAYVSKHYEELLSMTYRSFETYQGQYHLSSAISGKAGDIYKSWINGSLQPQSNAKIIVAEYEGVPIGYVTIEEDDFAVEGVLSSVSSEYRQYGAYKAMIAYIINYAYQNKKSFITGTQFDNFIVQGAWNSLGLRPFYSFYNIHFDNRAGNSSSGNIPGGGIKGRIDGLPEGICYIEEKEGFEKQFERLMEFRRTEMKEKYNRVLPSGELVFNRFDKAKYLNCGEGSSVYDSCIVMGNVKIGSHVWVGPNTLLEGSNADLVIGDFVSIDAGVMIYTHDSTKYYVSGAKEPFVKGPVTIKSNTVIGTMSTIAHNVTIGKHCVIGAHSFVNQDIPDFSIAAGVPAKIIGKVVLDKEEMQFKYF